MALWAVRVAKSHEASSKYTYGWQRAEILGALINAVFLIALCVTIFLEALQRFIQVPEVSNPKLVLGVGIAGLISNLVGLVLFHEHGHSHGGDIDIGVEADIESQHTHSHGGVTSQDVERDAANWEQLQEEHLRENAQTSELIGSKKADEHSPLKSGKSPRVYSENEDTNKDAAVAAAARRSSVSSQTHRGHFHSKPRDNAGKHSQKSVNMEGVFLHVMGDALGNIGVIITALFIWKTDFSWKFYMDPVTSLVITIIIFSSALPLCRRTSAILLQGVPQSVDADEVRDDIVSLPGVKGIHDLHIWILSEHLNVATVHVSVAVDSQAFMKLAQRIRTCMRGHGIASTTIQPEFCDEHNSTTNVSSSSAASESSSVHEPPACVLQGNKSSGGLSALN